MSRYLLDVRTDERVFQQVSRLLYRPCECGRAERGNRLLHQRDDLDPFDMRGAAKLRDQARCELASKLTQGRLERH